MMLKPRIKEMKSLFYKKEDKKTEFIYEIY